MFAIAGGILIAVAVLAAIFYALTLIGDGSAGCGWTLLAIVALAVLFFIF